LLFLSFSYPFKNKIDKYIISPQHTQPQHLSIVKHRILGRLPPKAGVVLPFKNPLDIFRAVGHLVHEVPAGIRKVLAILIPNLMFFQQLL
jgi:hypothetical protein